MCTVKVDRFLMQGDYGMDSLDAVAGLKVI